MGQTVDTLADIGINASHQIVIVLHEPVHDGTAIDLVDFIVKQG